MQFDADIIEKGSTRNYRTALILLVLFPLAGALQGFFMATLFSSGVKALALVIGGGVGYLLGREAGFWLKHRAQRDLCQVQVEKHLRSLVAAARVQRGRVPQPVSEQAQHGGRLQVNPLQ